MDFETLCVIGMGYIGLPTASIFASNGLHVIGMDNNPEIINGLRNGKLHIFEPGLRDLVMEALGNSCLQVSDDVVPADAFIIAVPTPFYEDKRADLRAVITASESIVPHLQHGNLVILESTSPPRTTIDIVAPILEKSGMKAGEDFLLAYSPERVLPGKILQELVENPRVIGVINRESAEAGRDLYRRFVKGDMILTDATTAEMVKLMENTSRDINIAIANEFARLAEKFDVDIWEAINIANLHPRVNILRPGVGVGGHCISVDPWFFVEKAPQISKLINQARITNDSQPEYVITQLVEDFDSLAGKTFTVLGITYKPDVDDVRESPALVIIQRIQELGGSVKAFDPYLSGEIPGLPFLTDDLQDALSNSDGVLLLVNHQEFLDLKPEDLSGSVLNKYIFDTRNILDKKAWKSQGFAVRILGDGRDD